MSTDDALTLVAKELVRMDENAIPAATISMVLGLPWDELELVRQSAEYKEAQVSYLKKKTQSLMLARERRENIVKTALYNVEATLAENVTDGDFALRALVVMQRLGKDNAAEADNMRDVQTPEGFVTLHIPAHLLGNISTASRERLDAQVVHATTQTKEVGMIGSAVLKSYMGLDNGYTVDGNGVIEAEPLPAKASEVTDFQAILS